MGGHIDCRCSSGMIGGVAGCWALMQVVGGAENSHGCRMGYGHCDIQCHRCGVVVCTVHRVQVLGG